MKGTMDIPRCIQVALRTAQLSARSKLQTVQRSFVSSNLRNDGASSEVYGISLCYLQRCILISACFLRNDEGASLSGHIDHQGYL